MHVVPFVQQQFKTLMGIITGRMMGSIIAILYGNEVEAVMMTMMKMMMMVEEGKGEIIKCVYVICV